uniref:Uncharacterized protein n=1 Tax=Eptatretus burgeri TaxID=7764 RepID=A0A8C4NIY4_EPTBU
SDLLGHSLDELTCTVCLELFEEPVALSCGHSFCHVCIEKYWKSREEATSCICPNCREVFPQKPKLKKNVILANLREQMKFIKREVELRIQVQEAEPCGLTCKKGVNSGDVEHHCEVCNKKAAKRCVPCEILYSPIICGLTISRHSALYSSFHIFSESLFLTFASDEMMILSQDSGSGINNRLEGKRRDLYRFVDEAVDLMKSQVNKTIEEKLSLLEQQKEKVQKQIEFLCKAESALQRAIQELESCLAVSADGQTLNLDPNSASPWILISQDLKMATRTKTEQPHPEHPDRFTSCNQVLSSESFSSGRHYWEVDVSSSRFCRIGICLNSIRRKGEGKECRIGRNTESWCLEKDNNKYTAMHNNRTTTLSVRGDPDRFGFFLDCDAGELTCFGDSRVLHVFRGDFTDPVKPALGIVVVDLFVGDSVQFCSL